MELVHVLRLNISESSGLNLGLGMGSVSASSVLSSVGVITFKLGKVRFEVFEAEVHETTTASVSSFAAVHKLLLREGDELATLQEVGAFHRTSGGESPARSALLLIFDGSDSTLGHPVNRIREVFSLELNSSISNLFQVLEFRLVSEERFIFLFSPVGHMVVTKLVVKVLLVLLSDVLVSFSVQCSSESELFSSLDVSAKFSDVLHVGNISGIQVG